MIDWRAVFIAGGFYTLGRMWRFWTIGTPPATGVTLLCVSVFTVALWPALWLFLGFDWLAHRWLGVKDE